jgi:hypothetical protein
VKEALLFLKKKKQKNFYLLGALAGWLPKPAVSKSFLLLFFKKEALAFLLSLVAWPARRGCRLSPA